MGTERPSCTLYDTLSNINTSDHKLQPGGKVSRDPSPRPAMTAKSEQNRDGSHEEDWRRDREREKMRDKARCKDQDPRDRYYERDRAPAQWPREGEREWRDRERRQEDDRRRHARPLSNMEKEDEREVERGMKKGDTFPRMRKNSGNHGRQITVTTEQDEERGERRKRERPKRIQADDWEREMERYKVMERDEMRSRAKEERQNTERRPLDDEKARQRQRYPELDVSFQERRRKRDDSWDRKERDAATKREKLRPDMGRPRLPSPHRQRDREIYAERVERDKVRRRERERDTRSEGDIDEREMKRERQRDRERDELQYHHSRSDGDSRGKRERDKQGYREEDRQRYRDRDQEREVVRSRKREVEKDREKYREVHRRVAGEADSERERCKENMRDMKDDRRSYERYKESRQGGGRETNKRELDHKRGDSTGRGTQSQSETAPRVPPRAQSSGEWSTAESDRDIDEYRSEELATERRENEQKRIDRQDRDKGEMSVHRRMWLEPQRGKNNKDAFSERERHTKERNMEQQTEWGGEQNRVKEEPDQYNLDQSSYRERHRGRNESSGDTYTEGVSVDGEELSDICGETDKGGKERLSDSDGGIERSRWSEAEGENVTHIIDGSDREEECGSDYWARSESEGGSDTGWQQERDRMLSGEDGFVTVSSGVDEEDDREEDEEEFEDCQEFLDSAVLNNDPSPEPFKGDKEREEDWRTGKAEIDEDDHGREKQPKYVFCVIGQTLPREKSLPEVDPAKGAETDISSLKGHRHDGDDTRWEQQDGQIINNQDTESKSGCNNSQEETEVDIKLETGDGISHGMEHPYAEIGPINRDSQTEKLLMEWREKNKEEMERKRDQPLQVPNNPYADVYSQEDFEHIQPILDRIDTGAMSPEEVEAIRIRLSRAWTMSEQPKRHSQAPHLKWAKNVVREILGNSEEQIVDETDVEMQKDKRSNQFETIMKNDDQEVEIIQKSDGQEPKLKVDEHDSDPELEEDESLEVEGLRGMGQGQGGMHAEQFTAMHGDTSTRTHADTLLDTDGKETDPSIPLESEKADIVVEVCEKAEDEDKIETEKLKSKEELEMYLSISNTLYKPNSCPILSYETESDLLVPSRKDESQEVEDRMVESEEERQEEESEQGTAEEVGSVGEGEESEVDSREMSEKKNKRGTLMSSCSFRDLGPEARIRRRGIRKTTERGNGEHVSVKEEEGVARDRRTRIFSTTDDEDDRSKSWGEVELRNVLDTIERRKRNSRFFNAAQLYQQYSEAAQNFEILRQARSDVVSASEDATPSPAPSPPPARRPLPPLPTVKHPHSLSNAGSISSVRSLPLPEPPKTERRASSPRLSISLSQSATLWRELPAVRNSSELGELTEDQRRLQEVRFEVVTSEASYCRSLDIVVEHFVKSKQLGALLGTQDRNWLFSRLADVRAISHSFLSKLEERMESNIMSFTVCDVITRNCQRFKMVYVPYLTNQSYQDATYQRLMNENPGFKLIVEKLERSPLCQRLPLRSFLVLPFQRITRLKLLVQNIVKRTSPGTPEATQAIKALKLLEKLIQESNDSITQMRSIESLVSLSAKVDFECRTLPLISQSRRMIREGPVIELIDFSLKDTERNIYLHLFNDYLLISLQKEGGRFTVIDHSPVSDLRVENCRVKLHSLQKNLFRLHMSNKALLLRTDTLSDKLRWISALSRPHPEIDFSTAQEFPQMQCIRAFVAQQPDELSLEKADIILVHQESSDHWVEGTRLPDQQRGWVPESHLETISNSRVRQRNLSDALKLTTATAAV